MEMLRRWEPTPGLLGFSLETSCTAVAPSYQTSLSSQLLTVSKGEFVTFILGLCVASLASLGRGLLSLSITLHLYDIFLNTIKINIFLSTKIF